ncbi:hypothetical protein BB561_002415 [Smittium simulii]|uniref:Uncharacterized protein n=1 Tax=Smittium simulii TaxID=133385 RepID=A0A2T9YQM0_9FUNG|nr:hypothetical protein BB561_002415 [Smittium simulii]
MNSRQQSVQASEQLDSKPVQVKLVLLGEAAVGKSSLVLRLVNNDFQENKEPTIGAAFLTHKCQVEDKTVKFEIWDTAGQERFHSLAPMYYRNAQAAIVVYDITRRSSLDKAKSWVKELQHQANPNIVIAFVGNKLDLVQNSDVENSADSNDEASENYNQEDNSTRQVSTNEAMAYSKNAELVFFETSAKNNINIIETFYEIGIFIFIKTKNLPFDKLIANQQALRGDQLNTGSVNISRQSQNGFSFGSSGQDGENSSKCSC